jgi:hydroxymethylbilane synthase
MTPLRLATRMSPMAIAQSQQVATAISARTGRTVELVGMSTHGDVSAAQLAQIGGTGVFVTGVRAALLDGTADLAVHSLKDLPTGPPDGIVLAAIPARDDPRDALVAHRGASLSQLRPGARIGTGSARRAAQLLMLRSDLVMVAVRGNAGTRLDRVRPGDLDAVVLAYAGLIRVGRERDASDVFAPSRLLPAPGQGALAVECAADRDGLAALLACVDDRDSRAATTAERSLLTALEAGCLAPIGAHAVARQGGLVLDAIVAAPDGSAALRTRVRGACRDAEEIGRVAADDLVGRGAGRIAATGGMLVGS